LRGGRIRRSGGIESLGERLLDAQPLTVPANTSQFQAAQKICA
jgi:hypothetical protein